MCCYIQSDRDINIVVKYIGSNDDYEISLSKLQNNPYIYPNILVMDIKETPLSRLPNLKGYYNLERLTIHNNPKLKTIDILDVFPKLTHLSITNNKRLKKIKGVHSLSSLEDVIINNNKKLKYIYGSPIIRSDYPIYKECRILNMANLTTLNIKHNSLCIPIIISNCPRLQNIDCSFNNIKMINMDMIPSLEVLAIANNKISGVLDVNKFPKLESLLCSDNQLTGIKCHLLSNLKIIGCSRNSISGCLSIYSKNIEHIYCSKNKINSLDLKNNHGLKQLSCYKNSITSLVAIEVACDHLERLYCSFNKVHLDFIYKMKKLRHLTCSYTSVDETFLTSRNIQKILQMENFVSYNAKLHNITPRFIDTKFVVNVVNGHLSLYNANEYIQYINRRNEIARRRMLTAMMFGGIAGAI